MSNDRIDKAYIEYFTREWNETTKALKEVLPTDKEIILVEERND